MAIVINKSQYRNLSCKLGKKNYINTVKGVEYKIDTTSNVAFEEGGKECTPAQLSVTNHTNKYGYRIDVSLFGAGLIITDRIYLRNEVTYIKGSYNFNLSGRTLTNYTTAVRATYNLEYKSYENTSNLIGSGNYTSSGRVFDAIKSENNRPTTDTDYDGSTSGMIPHGEAKTTGSGLVSNSTCPTCSIPTQYCNVVFLRKETPAGSVNPVYYYRVDYCFVISSGWNVTDINFWGTKSYHNYYHEVSKITISVTGTTVDKEEIEVSVGGSDAQGAKILELQTNELMQSSMSNNTLSFTGVANEIINAYKDNRLIATFDLVNNRKYAIDGVERYLRAGDRIKITDLEDNFISSQGAVNGNEFEIIKANSRWNGFFYKEITAKEILSSSTPTPQQYEIDYTTQGQGSSASINFVCDGTAAEGDNVSFTASLLDDTLEITNVIIYKQDGEAVSGLTKSGNVYSFTMPASPVMATFILNAKTYNLYITRGVGSNITVTRTSSPIRGAATGTLSSGAKIYYGDVLTVSVSAQTNYKNATYTGFTSGGSVSGNVSIVSSATPYAWTTVYSGSAEGVTSHGSFATVTNGLVNFTAPTRITGYAMWYQNYQTMGQYPTPHFTSVQLGGSSTEIASALTSDSYSFKKTTVEAYLDSSAGIKICAYGSQGRTGVSYVTAKFFITKIEQYC